VDAAAGRPILKGCVPSSVGSSVVRLTTRGALLALVAALILAVGACGDDGGEVGGDGPEVRPADEGIEGVVAIRIESAAHMDGTIDYDRRPPAGGPHNPRWLPCGFYDEAQDDELVVHSLEHGAVWLAYDPDLDDEALVRIGLLTRENDKVVATPDADLPEGAPVVASAWARQLILDEVGDPRLEAFVEQYQGGSAAPEAGAPC
jgi:hypothetical protein